MAATDNKTNFYVGLDYGDDTHGGSSAGDVKETQANCSSSGDGLTITNDNLSGWTSSAVGDFICFDTAGTKDYARITNISGDDLTVTPEVAFSASSKNVNVGGEWLLIDHAVGTVQNTDFLNADGDPITVWVKAGDYSGEHAGGTGIPTIVNAGTALLPITVAGYNTDEGDGYDYWDTDLPYMDGDSQTNEVGIRAPSGSVYWIFRHIVITGSSSGAFINNNVSNYITCEHCLADGNDGNGFYSNDYLHVINSQVSNNTGYAIDGYNVTLAEQCAIFSNAGGGIRVQNGYAYNNIFWDNNGPAFLATSYGALAFCGNIVDGGYDNVFGNGARTNSSGVNLLDNTPGTPCHFYNNLITNCDLGMYTIARSPILFSKYNKVDSCNTAEFSPLWIMGEGDEANAAGAPGFTNEAAANFQPTALSPANGAAGPLIIGLTTINRACGAAEPETAVGGGTTVIQSHRKVR